MFNEKNLPKLILITPIAFMALILIVATYIQIIDFNMVYEEETQQLQQIALNKDISNKKIEKLIQDKAIKKKSTIEKIVLVSFLILILMSLVAFIISKKMTLLLNKYKEDIEKSKNELLNTNLHLEEKIRDKTKKLEKFNEKLKNEIEKEVLKSRQKDSALFQQSKMAAIGEMLENIAHQWRQPLSTISTIASGMALKLEYNIFNQDEAKNELRNMVDTTKKLSNTIDYFQKYFSKSNVFEDFNLSDIIKSNLAFLEITMKSNHIDVVSHFKDDITIFGLKNEFAQALMNILNNAKDALISNVDVKYKRVICVDLYKENGKTIISILDNAGGIPQEIMDKIFDPYFTTKHKAEGVGIGLYMVQEIIVKHMKGILNVENQSFTLDGSDYIGAKFTIILDVQEQSN
jgi:two-component system, NtrC family, C4-dicarboxylate transport sensor histidine kinase DctB